MEGEYLITFHRTRSGDEWNQREKEEETVEPSWADSLDSSEVVRRGPTVVGDCYWLGVSHVERKDRGLTLLSDSFPKPTCHL